jgi:hypothetical protein
MVPLFTGQKDTQTLTTPVSHSPLLVLVMVTLRWLRPVLIYYYLTCI